MRSWRISDLHLAARGGRIHIRQVGDPARPGEGENRMKRLSAALALAFMTLSAPASSLPTSTTGPAPVLTPPVATAAPTPLAPNSAHALTAEDVSAYLDGMLPTTLKRTGVAGAVVVVVRNGQVLFEKGYGYADVAKKKLVDAKTTLFRPGSVSKLFTWTAVMQLVEQGKLDLNADINTYLDFKIPEAFGKPITLKNLMTHTPGFEETIKGLMTYDVAHQETLEQALKAWVPTRIFPPGEVPAYSNYGAALAGYIVQRVSHEPFEQYVANHIFTPLGMQHATFEQPLPKALAADMSQGYADAASDPKKFEIVFLSPAGALSAAGDDMAHFMIAHLNNGSYNGAQILKPETARLMHSMALQMAPHVPGMAYGFYHEDRNGRTIIGHGGDTQFFHSDLHLILDEGVGIFISMNSAGHADATPIAGTRKELLTGFMDRYFPAPHAAKTPPAIATAKDDAKKVAGLYHLSRRSDSNFLSLGDLIGQVPVTANDDGTLSVPIFLNNVGKPKKYREIAPGHWKEVDGPNNVDVIMKDGHVQSIFSDEFPQILTIQPVSAWQSMYLRLPLIGFALLMFTLTVIFWPIKAILRRRYGQPFELTGRARMLYRLTRVTALVNVLFVGAWTMFLVSGLNDLDTFAPTHDWIIRLIQIIGIIGVLGTVAILLNFQAALSDPARRWWTKVTDGLLVLSALVFVYFTFAYHLISLSLNY
jgi:CubicO group peptidase (beta-lactamase class C family)